jgi:hypothetical protein
VQFFNLSNFEVETLEFSVPVHFNGQPNQKIHYSVYMSSGRALHINSIYLYKNPPLESGIELYTDKQVYSIGENVTVIVNVTKTGNFLASAPSFYINETISQPINYSFTIPELLSGTYYVDYFFDNFTTSYPFDVNGYSVRIKEIILDKDQYTVGEDIIMQIILESNRNFTGLLRTTLYDQYLMPLDIFSVNKSLNEGENSFNLTIPIRLGGLGIYALNPRIYIDLPEHSYVLVTSGAKFFDVTEDLVPPAITINSPQNITYYNYDLAVNFTINEEVSWLIYTLDDITNITLTETTIITLPTLGYHRFTIFANDTSGNIGSNSIYFSIELDSIPPEIFHIPVTSSVENDSIEIHAMITDDGRGVEEVTLHYRKIGTLEFTKIEMNKCGLCVDTYNATIPPSAVTENLEYYINATDGTNFSTNGTATNPLLIKIEKYPSSTFPWEIILGFIVIAVVIVTVLIFKKKNIF